MIEPLSVPQAAGVDFSGLDVRHLAPGDGLTLQAITQATRHLAERDYQINQKLGEVITQVNNKEQLVNLPAIRTTLPPQASEIVTNYRIPSGYEARVLNAAVSSTPAVSVRLEILYASGTFGGSTGEELVSTTTEFTGETTFHGAGEFVVKLTNAGSTSAEVVASIVVTTRALADSSGAILGASAVGPQGDQGVQGDPGEQGEIGATGPQGPQGLVWKGPYAGGTTYFANDAVSHAIAGFGTWSFIATDDITGVTPQPTGTPWNVLVSGTSGTLGATGPQGPAGVDGTAPVFEFNQVDGTLYTQGDYVAGAAEGDYFSLAPGTHFVTMYEAVHKGGAVSPVGVAHLSSHRQLSYRGTVSLRMPLTAYGAEIDYGVDNAVVFASGDVAADMRITKHNGTSVIDFHNASGSAGPVSIGLTTTEELI